jgi:hypothetical protein
MYVVRRALLRLILQGHQNTHNPLLKLLSKPPKVDNRAVVSLDADVYQPVAHILRQAWGHNC